MGQGRQGERRQGRLRRCRTPSSLWLDLRSRASWVTHSLALALERDFDIAIDRRPHTQQIGRRDRDPTFFQRTLRHLFKDVRRFVEPFDRAMRGPTKTIDPFPVAAAFLFARQHGRLGIWLDTACARIFDRGLNIEDRAVMAALLGEIGLDPVLFRQYLDGNAMSDVSALQRQARKLGISGVPTFVLDGELFCGSGGIELLRLRLTAKGLARASAHAALGANLAT